MTATRRWRVAVAGCGGAAFGIHLPVLAALPGLELVAVADREAERARRAAVQFRAGRVARDGADLLTGADMLAVLTGVHESWIEQALASGVHVFTEKPVALDVGRTRELRRQAAQAGLLLEVGTIRAYDAAVEVLLKEVPAAGLRGGWLVKADGADEAARRRFLPPGALAYTFAADPVQPSPAPLSPAGRRALQILLWQGYHLLTVLALAVPRAQPALCTLTNDGNTVHAYVRADHGPAVSLSVGAAGPGVLVDQVFLTGPAGTVAAEFGSPYGPAGPGRVYGNGIRPSAATTPPAIRMWTAIAQRLTDHSQGRANGCTAELAETIERLAYGLAYLTTVGGSVPSRTRESS